jgi:galactofuranose transport system permease protein
MSNPALQNHTSLWIRRLSSLRSPQRLPLLATFAVAIILFAAAGYHYENFATLRVFFRFFINNSAMGIAAVGVTFVILQGGIDLSCGSVIACGSMVLAMLMEPYNPDRPEAGGWGIQMNPILATVLVVTAITLMGAFMGALIHYFELPPFLVTLGALFFYRGLALTINEGRVEVHNALYHDTLMRIRFQVPHIQVPHLLDIGPYSTSNGLPIMILFVTVAAGIYFSVMTAAGRSIYAVGGNETSASLMGLPVARTKISTYALGAFCSAIAAVVFTISSGSGDSSAHNGTELNAIAVVVVGGTLLTGGVGQVAGTILGVIIVGTINQILSFNGQLPPAVYKMSTGGLLLAFVILQKLIVPRRRT